MENKEINCIETMLMKVGFDAEIGLQLMEMREMWVGAVSMSYIAVAGFFSWLFVPLSFQKE